MELSMDRTLPEVGDIYRHFKGNHYQVICTAYHSETKEALVVYKNIVTNNICARPVEMFLSPVDKDKYPDVEQVYRFELCGNVK